MTDEPTAGETSTAVATTRPGSAREIRVVESTSGIMDTARFEHLFRVATVMAEANLLPDSLTTYDGVDDKGGKVKMYHDYATVRARAFLIANQADLWKADPNAVAQCTSLVHGKLMYEGKLVHGVVSERLGVDLTYEFGMFDFITREVTVGQAPEAVDDQKFGVRVSGTLPGETEPRYVHVCVSMLHTGSKGPWEKPSAWPRQLRYGGAREWTRAHKPSLLLGIMTDDEVTQEELAQGRRSSRTPSVKPDLGAKLAPAPDAAKLEGPAAGFSQAHVIAETEVLPPHDAETGEVLGEGGGQASNETQAQVDAEVEEEEGTREETAEDEITPGVAGPGETYMLASDEVDKEDNVQTYRDGEERAVVKVGAATADLNIYRDHPPKAEPTKAADPPKEKAGIRDNPEDRQPPAEEEKPTFMQEIAKMTSWLEVKPRFAALTRDADWAALEAADQDAVRAAVWRVVEQIKKDHKDPVDFAADPTAFRMWMETQEGPGGADAVEGSFRVLCKEPAYTRMKEEQRDNVRNAVEAKIATLRGKK